MLCKTLLSMQPSVCKNISLEKLLYSYIQKPFCVQTPCKPFWSKKVLYVKKLGGKNPANIQHLTTRVPHHRHSMLHWSSRCPAGLLKLPSLVLPLPSDWLRLLRGSSSPKTTPKKFSWLISIDFGPSFRNWVVMLRCHVLSYCTCVTDFSGCPVINTVLIHVCSSVAFHVYVLDSHMCNLLGLLWPTEIGNLLHRVVLSCPIRGAASHIAQRWPSGSSWRRHQLWLFCDQLKATNIQT